MSYSRRNKNIEKNVSKKLFAFFESIFSCSANSKNLCKISENVLISVNMNNEPWNSNNRKQQNTVSNKSASPQTADKQNKQCWTANKMHQEEEQMLSFSFFDHQFPREQECSKESAQLQLLVRPAAQPHSGKHTYFIYIFFEQQIAELHTLRKMLELRMEILEKVKKPYSMSLRRSMRSMRAAFGSLTEMRNHCNSC